MHGEGLQFALGWNSHTFSTREVLFVFVLVSGTMRATSDSIHILEVCVKPRHTMIYIYYSSTFLGNFVRQINND